MIIWFACRNDTLGVFRLKRQSLLKSQLMCWGLAKGNTRIVD